MFPILQRHSRAFSKEIGTFLQINNGKNQNRSEVIRNKTRLELVSTNRKIKIDKIRLFMCAYSLVSILVILTIFHAQIFEYLTYQDLGSLFIRSLKDPTARYPRIRSYEILGSDLMFSCSLRSVSE